MKIIKTPRDEEVGILDANSRIEANVRLTVRQEGGLKIEIENLESFPIEVSYEVELYEFLGFWRRVNTEVVFIQERETLLPGEKFTQILNLDLPPGRYRVEKPIYVRGIKIKVWQEFTVGL